MRVKVWHGLPMNGSRSRRLRHFCITVFERTESNTLQGFHVKDVSVFQTKTEKNHNFLSISSCKMQFHIFHHTTMTCHLIYPDCHEGAVKMLLTYLVETLLVDLVKLSTSPGLPILSFFTSKSTSNLRSLRISVWKIINSQFYGENNTNTYVCFILLKSLKLSKKGLGGEWRCTT